MLTIITIDAVGGKHEVQSQSHRTENWMGDEWIAVPEELAETARDCEGWCDLTIEDGVLVDLTPTEKPAPEPPGPSTVDILGQQVAHLTLEGMKKDQQIGTLGAQLVQAKLDIMGLRAGNEGGV